ncbi:MAG TPA: PEP-CTERM sorting domain-containing protein [Phycisphaerae bacterium]|nr:PEP-CTERM sorting domain-containing protein [Phycisphaerae bacterium]
MRYKSRLGAVLAVLVCSCPVWANYTKLDDFNRTPGTYMGPAWNENRLDFSIMALEPPNNVTKATNFAEMTYAGDLQGLSPTNDWFSVSAVHSGESAPQYAALVLRQADAANSVFIKIQDNNGDGRFDYVFFYRGTAPAQPWVGMTGGLFAEALSLPGPGNEVGIRASVADDFSHPGMLQVVVQIDGNHNGIWGEVEDDEFVRGNLNPAGLGTNVGLAGTGGALMDDFGGTHNPEFVDNLDGTYIPEPVTLALVLGGGLIGLGRRRIRVC